MDIRQLRYFMMVAEEGQVTSAAKRLNMEQPPLSRQLRLIEEELGVTLFDRSNRQFTLTSAGKRLHNRGEELLLQWEETMVEIKEWDDGVQGVLSIGAVVSCVSLLPPAIEPFRLKYPNVTFKIREGDHFLLAEQLHKRKIELIVARLPFEGFSNTETYSVLPLPPDPFIAIVPRQWACFENQSSVTLPELARYPYLTLKTDQTIGMHEQIMNEFKKLGVTANVICECASVAIIIALVSAGLGFAIIPKSTMSSYHLTETTMLEIQHAHFLSEIGIICMKDRYLSKSARRFIEEFTR